jgi:hypothetical protein
MTTDANATGATDAAATGGPTGDDRADRERVESRAGHLLPEERATGSDDPQAQADAILAESDEREDDQQAAPDTFLERRTSDQTVTPIEPPD